MTGTRPTTLHLAEQALRAGMMAGTHGNETSAIVWFRRDLRLADNPALAFAAASGRQLIPVFILETEPPARAPGRASLWWLDKSVDSLQETLRTQGSNLIFRRGNPEQILPELAREANAGLVVWNRAHDQASCVRDARLAARLQASAIQVHTFEAGLLLDPAQATTKAGGVYHVFTPFWRAARSRIGPIALQPAPEALRSPRSWPRSEDRSAWGLHPTDPDWSSGFDGWSPGEPAAQAQLARLLSETLDDYSAARDRPAVEGSSRLSPHLAWGEIGPRQVYCAVSGAELTHAGGAAQADKFLSELGWREFNYNLLRGHPDLARADVKPGFDGMAWRGSASDLRAWRRGRTGYPIVDAGMRQLWTQGWMHNRVRLIAASFLVKHLLIDWREGERWFWDTLVDADPANNPANWQWIAGTGADASPFFRIFNPVLQGERFDAQGDYVRRWVPELARLPESLIHKPWAGSPAELDAAGVELGRTYPAPVVDHAKARIRALDAFRTMRLAHQNPSPPEEERVG